MPRSTRFCHYIFNTLTVVSVLLVLAAVGLWVDGPLLGNERIWNVSDSLQFQNEDRVWFGRSDPNLFANKIFDVPHWFFALIFAILPAVWFFLWFWRRRPMVGKCPACGYDLTGNESGVCPECGAGLALINQHDGE